MFYLKIFIYSFIYLLYIFNVAFNSLDALRRIVGREQQLNWKEY